MAGSVLDSGWGYSSGVPVEYDVHCCFVLALVGAQEEVQPQLYADNLKCVCRDPGVLLRAARFTDGCGRLVGQEPAPGKCRTVRGDMRGWIVTDEGISGQLSKMCEIWKGLDSF